MIQEISERLYTSAVVCIWVVVVSATFATIWASIVNGELAGEVPFRIRQAARRLSRYFAHNLSSPPSAELIS